VGSGVVFKSAGPAAMLAIVLAMGFIPDQRTPLLFGSVSLGILLLAFVLRSVVAKKAALRPSIAANANGRTPS
jgi:hypothetical protein